MPCQIPLGPENCSLCKRRGTLVIVAATYFLNQYYLSSRRIYQLILGRWVHPFQFGLILHLRTNTFKKESGPKEIRLPPKKFTYLLEKIFLSPTAYTILFYQEKSDICVKKDFSFFCIWNNLSNLFWTRLYLTHNQVKNNNGGYSIILDWILLLLHISR